MNSSPTINGSILKKGFSCFYKSVLADGFHLHHGDDCWSEDGSDILNKPAEAVRKTASADIGNPYKDAKNQLLRIKPLIVEGMFTKIGQKLFTH